MSKQTHKFFITSKKPPVLEIDREAGAIYVRFSTSPVAQSLRQGSGMPVIVVDLDKDGNAVGLEAVGVDSVSVAQIQKLADRAHVATPAAYDWNKMQMAVA